MPDWVNKGFSEYAKRLPHHIQLELCEVALLKRSKSADNIKLIEKEGLAMLHHIPDHSHVIALDVKGKRYTSEKLAIKLNECLASTPCLCLLVGGPEGLAPVCRTKINESWSLSDLTLPHPLVRIVLAETLYRAWTITTGHPYHK